MENIAQKNRERLFQFFASALESDNFIVGVTNVDRFIEKQKSGIFLKHDIHGLSLDSLIKFAMEEESMDIYGTYFFMAPGHPLTQKKYTASEQIEAMHVIESFGHELGLHVDPYFLIQHYKQPLNKVIDKILSGWRGKGLTVRCGNIHGNSRFKGLDNNGYGTSFDLFKEVARQPDYPTLNDVPEKLRNIIYENRTSLESLEIEYWADMPLWSKKNRFVVTNYLSDNLLSKKGVIHFVLHEDTIGKYKLSNRQPPGYSTPSCAKKFVDIKKIGQDIKIQQGAFNLEFLASAALDTFRKMSSNPMQILLHPQHYL